MSAASAPALLDQLAVEVVPIDSLTPWPDNPRTHDLDVLRESLSLHGQYRAIVVQRSTRRIVAGNGTWEAARLLGWGEIAASLIDVDDERARRIVAVDNRSNDLAGYDEALLVKLLSELPDLQGTGFKADELAALVEKLEAAYVDGEEQTAARDAFAIFGMEAIAEAAFEHFRERGFPYPAPELHECMQEINRLATTPDDSLLGSRLAYHVADRWQRHRFDVRCAQGRGGLMKAPTQAFADDKLLRRAIALVQEYMVNVSPLNLLAQVSLVSGTQAAANFRPGFALSLYRRFLPLDGVALDTSTGFGGRLVGFLASQGALYIGIDPSTKTHAGNRAMCDALGVAERAELHCCPAEDLDASLVAGRCDFAFTSPPYFAKERYSDEQTQSWRRYGSGVEWRDGFLTPMLALQFAALKPGRRAAVNIEDVQVEGETYPLEQWTIEAGRAAGFEYLGRERYGLNQRVGQGHTDEVAAEAVLFFERPEKGRSRAAGSRVARGAPK